MKRFLIFFLNVDSSFSSMRYLFKTSSSTELHTRKVVISFTNHKSSALQGVKSALPVYDVMEEQKKGRTTLKFLIMYDPCCFHLQPKFLTFCDGMRNTSFCLVILIFFN